MFESVNEQLAPIPVFLVRLIGSIFLGLIFIVIALFMGMIGYHVFDNLPWVDAFVNAAMILSGMGPVSVLQNNAAKVFAGFYALFSGLAFILIIGMIFAPAVHRFFHKLHVDIDDTNSR